MMTPTVTMAGTSHGDSDTEVPLGGVWVSLLSSGVGYFFPDFDFTGAWVKQN